MVMRGCVGAAVLIVALAACAAKPVAQGPGVDPGPEPAPVTSSPGPAVPWQGHRLQEVTSLKALPAAIREALDVDGAGISGVADKGQPFNVGDAIIEPWPMRRFVTAGHDGDLWLVVLEYGGVGYSIQVMEYAGGEFRNRWALFDKPGSLADAVQRIANQRPENPAQ